MMVCSRSGPQLQAVAERCPVRTKRREAPHYQSGNDDCEKNLDLPGRESGDCDIDAEPITQHGSRRDQQAVAEAHASKNSREREQPRLGNKKAENLKRTCPDGAKN